MTHFAFLAPSAVVMVLAGLCAAPVASAADKSTESPLVGTWIADSVSVVKGGQHETLPKGSRPTTLTISETQFTLRTGNETLAEMSYAVDPKQDPPAIDLKSADGAMLGIYARDGETLLRISLNDAAKGRPHDFANDHGGLVLVLRRSAAPLDLAALYNYDFDYFKASSGRQAFDGLPFQVGGQVRIYGRRSAQNGEVYPTTKNGIRVGRAFTDLYLIHHTQWPDVEGETVAYVVLHYADGTQYVIPIRYGVHVRDWFNLPSYEKETVTDPDTTICWRHEPAMFNAPMRIFKSKFSNPAPEKVVETIDLVSARNLASYVLLAATVAKGGTTGARDFTGDRHFDGKLRIHVVDDATGKPVVGALVLPSMDVSDQGVVGSPFYSSATGEGTIPYPTKDTSSISASVEKKGYQSQSQNWPSSIPDSFTFRLKPGNADEP